MDSKSWNALNELRSSPIYDDQAFLDFLRNSGVSLDSIDLPAWGIFLNAFRVKGGPISAPAWLNNVFCALAKASNPRRVCDPWAGIGFLAESLRIACHPEQTFAFVQREAEHEIGKRLLPHLQWELGDPLQLLKTLPCEIDLAASVLPFAMRASEPLKKTTVAGEEIELNDELGNLILVDASLRLTSSGRGLFVVSPSLFVSKRSIYSRLGELGLGIKATLALPSGTFAPHSNVSAYLVVTTKKPVTKMFVAQLTRDENTNSQILENLEKDQDTGTFELGRFVNANSFVSIEAIKAVEKFRQIELRFGSPSMTLGELATSIVRGVSGDSFTFSLDENSVYLPTIGDHNVVESPKDMTLKGLHYVQVVIDPARSDSKFVARFLNSSVGKELRENSKMGSSMPRLTTRSIEMLPVFVPALPIQRSMLEVEARLTAEQYTVLGLQNELRELRQDMWSDPRKLADVEVRLTGLSKRLSGGLKTHTDASLDQWFETLPFPLASILRAWQATPSEDFKTKHEHLLHFFEGAAEFVSIILLSAFSSNEDFFAPHKQKIGEVFQKQNLSFQRATFGTWRIIVEYLGKQTRDLLSVEAKKSEDSRNSRALCADIFGDPTLSLPQALSRKELAAIFSLTNKKRNDWSGHGGVVGQEEARLRNEQLLTEVQMLREVIGNTWADYQLIRALHCRPRRGQFDNELAILMGSNTEFLKESRTMSTWLDVERLYLSRKGEGRALKLLPLIQVGASPQSAKNACYFFNRLEREGGARFVSYHFADKPELSGEFSDATDAIKLLTTV